MMPVQGQRNKCSVCGKRIKHGLLNCEEHAHIIARMVSLVQEIVALNERISSETIHKLAEKHKCHPQTVRNHMKNEGYRSYRGWEKC